MSETIFLSYLDRTFAKLGNILEPYVPRIITPNIITLLGLAADLVAGIALYFAAESPIWFIVALVGILIHIVADSVDGAVARTRGQASKLGAFLDQMTDNFSFLALPLGIGLSGQAQMEIVVFVIIMILLHAILMYNWMLLTEKRVFPIFGSVDYEASIIVTILLMLFLPDVGIAIAGHTMNWFEMAFAAGSIWSFADLCLSMRRLVRELRTQ